MRRKLYPINVLSRANLIATAWNQIGTSVTIGNLTYRVFTADITQAGIIETRIREAELQLSMRWWGERAQAGESAAHARL